MEFTKQETRTLIVACSVAIEHQTIAIQQLEREHHGAGVQAVIAERVKNLRDLNKLRHRLTSEN